MVRRFYRFRPEVCIVRCDGPSPSSPCRFPLSRVVPPFPDGKHVSEAAGVRRGTAGGHCGRAVTAIRGHARIRSNRVLLDAGPCSRARRGRAVRRRLCEMGQPLASVIRILRAKALRRVSMAGGLLGPYPSGRRIGTLCCRLHRLESRESGARGLAGRVSAHGIVALHGGRTGGVPSDG